MGQDKLSSFLLSFCLHLAFFTMVLLWPVSKPKIVDIPSIGMVNLVTLGSPGKMVENSKQLTPQGGEIKPAEVIKKTDPIFSQPENRIKPPLPTVADQPRVEPPSVVKPVPEQISKPTVAEAKPVLDTNSTIPLPPSKNATQVAVAPEKKPDVKKPDVKKPDVKKPDVKKPDIKKPDVKKPDVKKPDVKKPDVKKPDVKKPDVKKPEPQKAVESDKTADQLIAEMTQGTKGTNELDDVIRDIMEGRDNPEDADPRRAAGGVTRKNTGESGDVLSQGLPGGREIGGGGVEGFGMGPGGSGGDGVGQLGSYDQVITADIRRNWTVLNLQIARQNKWSATVFLTVDIDGSISQRVVQEGSGDRTFDASLIGAIDATRIISEPPPTGQPFNIILEFAP